MGLKRDLSFSSGELDPVLHDRVTLARFGKGLATARNVIISKTGSIMTRFCRAHFKTSKNADESIVLFSPPNSGKILEWGPLYVRVYDFDGTLDGEVTTLFTEEDLPHLHFIPTGDDVHVVLGLGDGVSNNGMFRMVYNNATPALINISAFFLLPTARTFNSITKTGPATGYAVDYLVTIVIDGEESEAVDSISLGTTNLPITAGHSNLLKVRIRTGDTNTDDLTEMRVYRRPTIGGAYGYIGSSTYFYVTGSDLDCDFEDLGFAADFTNGVQTLVTKEGLTGETPDAMFINTGTVYQQRLLLGGPVLRDNEAIMASRPGHQGNFYRDVPYDDDSALLFKAGTSGTADVLRMVDSDGLIVFTSIGVFVNAGTLRVTNSALEKKGSWVIKESLAPLVVPGGVFFVEKDTNIIRQLIFLQDSFRYDTLDHTIFSNHLFEEKTIESWGFQEGVTPMIIVTFSDGTWATFTYHSEHKMRAWTRHDSTYPVEQVEGTGIADASFFVTNKDGQRHIEVSLPRKIPADTFVANPEADKIALNALMDGAETTSNLLNDSLGGSDVFLLALTTTSWEDPLTLTCGTSALFPDPGLGAVGTIFKFFDVTDKSEVYLEVTARASDNSVTVEPSAEFPSAQASGFRLYQTYNVITGLDHLEGESVSVMVDGHVSASPNNDADNYDTLTVSSGSITLPNDERGAIIIVGRPIVSDVKTLNISTVEQQSTIVESLTVNKLYIRVHKTRGLHVSNKFPEEATGTVDDSSVDGMEDLDIFDDPSGYDIIGNRYKQPDTKRIEQTIPGSWDSQGQMSFRQVDPVHFEILSIIADVEVLKRSDK